MLAEVFAQLRFAASILFGISFDGGSLERLTRDLRETREEFGAIDAEGAALVGSPALDEATRRDIQIRRFRSQTVRAARETAFYSRLFEQLGLVPARLGYEDIARIPPPTKDAPRTDPDGFVCRTARPGPGSFAGAQDLVFGQSCW
ncbi:MAG TPA: hypothetical protein VFM55_19320 [Micromonosporaceae bacterium]|nr:hypothetical protein [Micromonosporaceae bacterium]